jgi:hypothetical protein
MFGSTLKHKAVHAGWAIMPSAVYLTLAEMRSTLGALVSIEIR